MPKWGDVPAGQATSSPFTANSSTPIGRDVAGEEQYTASRFCHANGYFLDSWDMELVNKTIAYNDDVTHTWKTKTQASYEQIACDDGLPQSISVNMASSSVGYNPTTTIASSTSIQVYGSMTAGEVLIILLLFLIIVLKLTEYMAKALSIIKTKKRFLGYGGGDVEIREDL